MSIKKILSFIALLAVVVVMSLSTAFAGNDASLAPLYGADSPTAAEGLFIIVLQDEQAATTGAAVQEVIAENGGRITYTYQSAINGFAAELTPDALAKLREHPDVAYIQADQLMHVEGLPADDSSTRVIEDNLISRNAGPAGPTSSSNANTWPLDRINQRNLPLNGNSAQIADGSGVHVYVIDSGINTSHQEFTFRVGAGYSALNSFPNYWEDCTGGGTAVAGAIGGTTYGVAPDVTLHAVRVVDCQNNMLASDIIEAFEWVELNHVKPAVVNFGLVASAGYQVIDAAVTAVMDAGVTVVLGAGNWIQECNVSPARMARPITVAAVNENDTPTYTTGQGPCVDLFAPGGDYIEMAAVGGPTATMVGMLPSLASGYTAGTAALALEISPNDTHDMVKATIVNAATRGAVTGGFPTNRIKCSVNMMLYSGLEPSGLPIPSIDARTCIVLCGFTVIAESETDLKSSGLLESLYALRDTVFAGTELGEHYTELYYSHTDRVTELIIEVPALRMQLVKLMAVTLPGVNDMLSGEREAARVTPEMIVQAQEFLRAVSEADQGGEVTQVIEHEMEQVPWDSLSDRTFKQAWDIMQQN